MKSFIDENRKKTQLFPKEIECGKRMPKPNLATIIKVYTQNSDHTRLISNSIW